MNSLQRGIWDYPLISQRRKDLGWAINFHILPSRISSNWSDKSWMAKQSALAGGRKRRSNPCWFAVLSLYFEIPRALDIEEKNLPYHIIPVRRLPFTGFQACSIWTTTVRDITVYANDTALLSHDQWHKLTSPEHSNHSNHHPYPRLLI